MKEIDIDNSPIESIIYTWMDGTKSVFNYISVIVIVIVDVLMAELAKIVRVELWVALPILLQ
jgi:hypothetical protein